MALELLAFVVVLAIVSRWVLAPVTDARRPALRAGRDLPALEAERDARLAAIRDAELDLRTGKLSVDEHRALDAELRLEALQALRALDGARAADGRVP